MEKVVKQMQTLAAASPRENSGNNSAGNNSADNNSNNNNGDDGSKLTSCVYCVGMSVYTRDMLNERLPPRCKGLEIEFAAPRDRVDAFKTRAAKPRADNFTFLGIGLSVYSRAWMYEGERLPLVKGLGVIAIEDDASDVMAAIEQRKRIRRELERERRRQRGDLDDGTDGDLDGDLDGDDDDDDDDWDLVEELFGDDDDVRSTDDAGALVEKPPLVGVGKPRLPPLLPVFTVEDLVDKSVESATYAAHAMYSFWAKRLDGFGARYVESCERLVAQMEVQATRVPQNCSWLLRQIERTLTGGRDDDNGSSK